MKYYPQEKNPINYFEGQRKKLHLKRYRYYFFDYMYYSGERRSEKGLRLGGINTILFYWTACIMVPLFFYVLPVQVASLTGNERILGFFVFSIILPLVFSLLRYRSERRIALMNHYRRSKWYRGIPVWLICSAWVPICILEFWTMSEMGWLYF